jgi:CheY-like chemotaxis protein
MEPIKIQTVLLAEDDDDDYLLTTEAMQAASPTPHLYRVKDGEELMDYLLRQGRYHNPHTAPRPAIILLDLNMPRKDGREALREIKAHPELHRIPVVVLTTSRDDHDILRIYDLGASSFIQKPARDDQFFDAIRILTRYWFEKVELPAE